MINTFFIQLFIMLHKYLTLVFIHLKRVLEFLLYHPFYNLQEFPITTEEEVKIWHPQREEEVQVLFFKFCSFTNNPDHEPDPRVRIGGYGDGVC